MPRPRVLYFKEFLPTPVCIVLSLFFATVFQFNGGVFLPTAVQMSSALGCIQEGCHDGRLCLIHRHDPDFPDLVPAKIPLHDPADLPDSLPCPDCL